MMVCLDTSFIIDFLRGKESAVEHMRKLEASSESITVAAPTLFELAEGATLAESRKEGEAILELLESLTVLPLNAETSLLAGEISASLILSGEQIGQMDILIGAVARYYNEPLVTANIKHFERIKELQIIDYTKK